MIKTDNRIDEYIEKSAEFEKPIQKHLPKLVHEGNPVVVEWKKQSNGWQKAGSGIGSTLGSE
jgi:hypothetical protein